MKQYIGISRDHSGSMSGLSNEARKDYNDLISSVKSAAKDNDIDTIVTVSRCGIRGGVDLEVTNSSVSAVKSLVNYPTDGQTPLFDSVGTLIDLLRATPDSDSKDVSFLIMAITDGQENASRKWDGYQLARTIKELQSSDRWTFVFRVPRGYTSTLTRLGIPVGNIQEWDQTVEGLHESSQQTQSAVTRFYSGLSAGIRSTDSFYANAAQITPRVAKGKLVDISGQVEFFSVSRFGDKQPIQEFIEGRISGSYRPGTVFYELTKTEKAVQSYKMFCIRNKKNGAVYSGQQARDLLGLPSQGTIKLSPGIQGEWDIFVQSMSNNRLLIPGTSVLYWPNAK